MFSIYERITAIFDDHISEIEFPYAEDIEDFDDYIVITSTIAIPNMKRGWTGDIIFRLSGVNATDGSPADDTYVAMKEVLCSNCKFEKGNVRPIEWQYKFLKY